MNMVMRDRRRLSQEPIYDTGRSLFARELAKYTSLDATASDIEAYLAEYWESTEDNE